MNGTWTLLPHHRAELEQGSGIAPDVIARRGYRSVTAADAAALGFAPSQRRAGLFLPTYTLVGVQRLGMLKPDQPRTGEDGRVLKYEWPAGQPPLLDCHPDALARIKTPGVYKLFTEGHKKSDAAWTRGIAGVNLPGVWMFLNGRLVVPDLDEIPLTGETCYVVFDSDVTRKSAVELALLRFCAALHRRGARVFVVYLPEGAGGAKVGLDDFFVAGGTEAGLFSLAQPWDGAGPGVYLHRSGENTSQELQATISALMQAMSNPELSRADLHLMAAVAALSAAKLSRGETEPDGRVVLTPGEISDDWRPAPPPGERTAPRNPAGTRPRIARERVGALMTAAVQRGLFRAEARPTARQHSSGTWYKATDWVVTPAPTFQAMIAPWASFRPDESTDRKPRSEPAPCPHCGEKQPTQRVAYCRGCGAERQNYPPFRASDKLSEEKSERVAPDPDPTYLLSDELSEAPDARTDGDICQPELERFDLPERYDPDRYTQL
ncbi:MAG: DUF3854 domain-containing protein, partial [Myxococcales bacterium]